MKNEFPPLKNIPVKGRLKTCLDLIKKEKLKGKVLVDVGCSSGWFEFKLQREGLKEVIGVDSKRKAIAFAKKNVKKARFFVSPADRLPVKDASADLVTMFDVIEHVPKGGEIKALREAVRVLKKKGKLFLSTPNFHIITNLLDPAWYLGHRHYKPEKIRELVEKAGFRVLELEVRGGLWSICYMLWFYLMKWVFAESLPRNTWLENKDDEDYLKKSIFTAFVVAEKI